MGTRRSSNSRIKSEVLESINHPSSPSTSGLPTPGFNPPASAPPVSVPPAYDPTTIFRPKQSDYRTLEVSCAVFANLVLSIPAQPHTSQIEAPLPTPVFYVKNNIYKQYGPSVTLTDKSINGVAVGFVELRWGRSDLFGLGRNSALVRWQDLRRVSSVTHSRFEFEFDFGTGKRKFIWRRIHPNIIHNQPDLVLHEIIGWGVLGSWGSESREMLARYTGMRTGRWKRKGKLLIKRGVTGEYGGGYHDCVEKEEDEWGEWEKVVVLTAMAIVEAARRRSIVKTPDPKRSEASPY